LGTASVSGNGVHRAVAMPRGFQECFRYLAGWGFSSLLPCPP
jgi:hypothetical protein